MGQGKVRDSRRCLRTANAPPLFGLGGRGKAVKLQQKLTKETKGMGAGKGVLPNSKKQGKGDRGRVNVMREFQQDREFRCCCGRGRPHSANWATRPERWFSNRLRM